MKGWITVRALSELSGEFDEVSLRADSVVTVAENVIGAFRVCSLIRIKNNPRMHAEIICTDTARYIHMQIKYAHIEDWNSRPKEFWDALFANPTTSTEYQLSNGG